MVMIQALGIFAVTYLLMSKPRWPIAQLDRPTIGLIGAVLMIAAGVLTPAQAYQAIDWNTIVLLLLISGRPPRQLMVEVDGPLLLFFGALFIIVAGLDAAGVLAKVSTWVLPLFHARGLLGIVHFS
jgi:Na+/H+ antiporter NhaD/arsenite permease-like protein